jgi:hypothetical protein
MTALGPRIEPMRHEEEFLEYIGHVPAGRGHESEHDGATSERGLGRLRLEHAMLATMGEPRGVLPLGSALLDAELIGPVVLLLEYHAEQAAGPSCFRRSPTGLSDSSR